MIKAVIFDFDDTLVHTFRNSLENLKHVVRNVGLHMPSMEHLRAHYGLGMKEFVTHLWPHADPMEFAKAFGRSESVRPCPPVRGVHEVIDFLSRKYILGIVTGRDRGTFQHSLLQAGIDFNKFAFMFTQSEVQVQKGSPQYFSLALKQLEAMGIQRNEVLFVADSVFDYESANAAGMPFVGVMTGPTSMEQWEESGLSQEHLIPSIMELPTTIEHNGFHQ